jgi:hypothetical protein
MSIATNTLTLLIIVCFGVRSTGQTVAYAMERLGVGKESATFNINSSSMRIYVDDGFENNTGIHSEELNFDTLSIKYFYADLTKTKSQNNNLKLGRSEVYYFKNQSLVEFFRKDKNGKTYLHISYSNSRIVKIEDYYPLTSTVTAKVYTYDKSGRIDSGFVYKNGVLSKAEKIDSIAAPKNSKKSLPPEYKIVNRKIVEVPTMFTVQCPCKSIFNYRGEQLVSIASSAVDKPDEIIHQVWFDEHGLVTEVQGLTIELFGNSIYYYTFDAKGRWLSRTDEGENQTMALIYREFK